MDPELGTSPDQDQSLHTQLKDILTVAKSVPPQVLITVIQEQTEAMEENVITEIAQANINYYTQNGQQNFSQVSGPESLRDERGLRIFLARNDTFPSQYMKKNGLKSEDEEEYRNKIKRAMADSHDPMLHVTSGGYLNKWIESILPNLEGEEHDQQFASLLLALGTFNKKLTDIQTELAREEKFDSFNTIEPRPFPLRGVFISTPPETLVKHFHQLARSSSFREELDKHQKALEEKQSQTLERLIESNLKRDVDTSDLEATTNSQPREADTPEQELRHWLIGKGVEYNGQAYTVTGHLGRGAIATVFRIENQTGESAALKIALNPPNDPEKTQELVTAFTTEATVLRSLNDNDIFPSTLDEPNDVVREVDGAKFITLATEFIDEKDYLPAHNLSLEHGERGKVSEKLALSFIEKYLIALNAMHVAGFECGDKKLADFLLQIKDNQVSNMKIIDFNVIDLVNPEDPLNSYVVSARVANWAHKFLLGKDPRFDTDGFVGSRLQQLLEDQSGFNSLSSATQTLLRNLFYSSKYLNKEKNGQQLLEDIQQAQQALK